MPVLIRNLNDDEATIIMVDSNIQREDITPGEKAFAYKMKFEALKHQGSKGDKFTADIVGEKAGESGRTVHRYIRLTELIPEILQMVDSNMINVGIGERLSYLRKNEQIPAVLSQIIWQIPGRFWLHAFPFHRRLQKP